MIYAFQNGNFKIKDSHGVKYEIPLDRPDFLQVNFLTFFAINMKNIIQGLLLKAVNNHIRALSDPIVIRNFPDPNNPNILHPLILNLFQSVWNGYYYGPPSSTDLTLEFRYNIQSRV